MTFFFMLLVVAKNGPITIAGTGCTKDGNDFSAIIVLSKIESGSIVSLSEKKTS